MKLKIFLALITFNMGINAMEHNKEASSLQEKVIGLAGTEHLNHLLGFLEYQESLFKCHELFNQNNCSISYLIELDGFNRSLAEVHEYFADFKDFSEYLEPLLEYVNDYICNGMKTTSKTLDAAKAFFIKYQNIRNHCFTLKFELKKIAQPIDLSKQQPTIQHLFTKEKLGFSPSYSDEHFINNLHSIMRALEVQAYTAEIIELQNDCLELLYQKKLQLDEALSSNAFLSKESTETNSPDSAYIIKTPKNIENRFIIYCLSSLTANIKDSYNLINYASQFIDHEDPEIRDYAALCLTQGEFQVLLAQYSNLRQIFLEVYKLPKIIDMVNLYCCSVDSKWTPLIPLAFFQFITLQNKFINSLINPKDSATQLNAIKIVMHFTEEFLIIYSESKETASINYKRLKDTIRSLLNQGLKLFNEGTIVPSKSYWKDCVLEKCSIDNLAKNRILSNEEIAIINNARKIKSNKELLPSSLINSSFIDEQKINPTQRLLKQRKAQHKKKSRTRRNRRQNYRKETGQLKHDISKIQSAECDKNKAENICLASKKIAKKIIDGANNMNIYVYCLPQSEPDPSAGKHINYDDRVQKWFVKPQAALEEKNYALDDPRIQTSIPFHSFSKEVDKYALKWGFKKKNKNSYEKEVREFHLPGVIEKDGKTYDGLFVYVIDAKMLCYHRFFHLCDWHKTLAQQWHIEFED